MLVLTRRKNQSIVIGEGITITVLEVKGDNIRLGIDAPRDVQVFREELLTAVSAANTSAVLAEGAAAPLPQVAQQPDGPPAAGPAARPTPLRIGRRRSA